MFLQVLKMVFACSSLRTTFAVGNQESYIVEENGDYAGVSLIDGAYSAVLQEDELTRTTVIQMEFDSPFEYFGKQYSYATYSLYGILTFSNFDSHTFPNDDRDYFTVSSILETAGKLIEQGDDFLSTAAKEMKDEHTISIRDSAALDISSDTAMDLYKLRKDIDSVYLVRLRGHLAAEHVHGLASEVRRRHGDAIEHSAFRATVVDVLEHVKFVTVHAPSSAALEFLRSHEQVHSVKKDSAVSILGREQKPGTETGTRRPDAAKASRSVHVEGDVLAGAFSSDQAAKMQARRRYLRAQVQDPTSALTKQLERKLFQRNDKESAGSRIAAVGADAADAVDVDGEVNEHVGAATETQVMSNFESAAFALDAQLWNLDRIDQASLPLDGAEYIPDAATNAGAGVSIFVLDTGLDAAHNEFTTGSTGRTAANVYNHFGALSNNTDFDGHGTHCAGTAAGTNVGAAPAANVFGVKVLGNSGAGSDSSVIAGINYVMGELNDTPLGLFVVSMSLGFTCLFDCDSSNIISAVDALSDMNVPVVVAGGNDDIPACLISPAASSKAITVGATTILDERSNFTNYRQCVDIYAPGSDVVSACSSLSLYECSYNTSYPYISFSGTSMATPLVAGVVALWLSQTGVAYTSMRSTPSSIKSTLQCFGSRDQISNFLDSSTAEYNVLVQEPPAAMPFTSFENALADSLCSSITSGCPNGTADQHSVVRTCSGNGECYFGKCVCGDYWMGAACDSMFPLYSIIDAVGTNGDGGAAMSDAHSPPYNSIAFFWTILSSSAASNAKFYHGRIGTSSKYAVVFENVPSSPTLLACTLSLELLMDTATKDFRIAIRNNKIGNVEECVVWPVSIGFKGERYTEADPSQTVSYEQLAGRASAGIPATIMWSMYPKGPTAAPTPIPTAIPTAEPTFMPTIVPKLRFESNVTLDGVNAADASELNSDWAVAAAITDAAEGAVTAHNVSANFVAAYLASGSAGGGGDGGGGRRMLATVSNSSFVVRLEMVVTLLNMVDYDESALVAAIGSTLAEDVSSGAFTTRLQSKASERGASVILGSASGNSSSSASSFTLLVTPTPLPTALPTAPDDVISVDSDSDSSSPIMEMRVIIPLVIVAVTILLAAVGGVYYYNYYYDYSRRNVEKGATATSPGEGEERHNVSAGGEGGVEEGGEVDSSGEKDAVSSDAVAVAVAVADERAAGSTNV